MTITLDLTPDMEAQLRETVARRDAGAIRRFLAEALAPTIERLLRDSASEPSENVEALLDQLADEFEASAGPDVAPLSDDAVTRAGIYREHP